MRSCTAITKKGKPCPFKVEDWRDRGLCHLHDPKGKFKQQVKSGEFRKNSYKSLGITGCNHTWYMREPGIMCTKCLIIWEKELDE
jgi:hypothetical protein